MSNNVDEPEFTDESNVGNQNYLPENHSPSPPTIVSEVSESNLIIPDESSGGSNNVGTNSITPTANENRRRAKTLADRVNKIKKTRLSKRMSSLVPELTEDLNSPAHPSILETTERSPSNLTDSLDLNEDMTEEQVELDVETKEEEVEVDSDVDDGYDYDELMISINKINLDTAPEAHTTLKFIKSLQNSSSTTSIAAVLTFLEEAPLSNPKAQLALLEYGGIELLIQLLQVKSLRTQISICSVLSRVAVHPLIQARVSKILITTKEEEKSAFTLLKELLPVNKQQILRQSQEELLESLKLWSVALEALGALCKNNAANRRLLRHTRALTKIVSLLTLPFYFSDFGTNTHPDRDDSIVNMCGAACFALWMACKNSKNRLIVFESRGITTLCKLLKLTSKQPPVSEVIVNVLGCIMQNATDEQARVSFAEFDIMVDIINYLCHEEEKVRSMGAGSLFALLHSKDLRAEFRRLDGLKSLVELLGRTKEETALSNVVGALCEAARDSETSEQLVKRNAIPQLVRLLQQDQYSNIVKIRVSAALQNLAKIPAGSKAIRNANGLPILVKLLMSTDYQLLANVTGALWQCGLDAESAKIISDLDGIRLIWSHLRSKHHIVQANAAGAIVPLLSSAENVSTVGRSFVGGLEMLISLLTSDSNDVLANTCAAVARIATNTENLEVITEDGIIPLLAALVHNNDDNVKKNLADAIAAVCRLPENRVIFGQLGGIEPLVEFLKCNDEAVHESTAKALAQLSKSAPNSYVLRKTGAVSYLVKMISCNNDNLQDYCAETVQYIRRHHITLCEANNIL
eukprot:TRINITY_DN3143_c5_g2_i2.p1 TRINITY_DN3143_c5_g2~~TRINITY_DN3143_c5_g2_i2.p1  ORF type:complete len:805 (-),score=178.47 TRINITY_DN3143_c5_g2_i2:326-2740(-)